MNIEDKFNMTLEQNIFVAKRNIVDYIWKSANLEGINVTFPETQKIYEGGNVGNLRIDEIVAINNLKHGWQFILSTITSSKDFNYLSSINAIVGSNLVDNAGRLRSGDVRIGGTKWKPELPNQNKFKEDIKEINQIENITERAITQMCYIMRSQMFWDGNKRTAMLFANHEMVKNGKGIITISIDIKDLFGEKLTEYYETNNMENLKQFVYENCIDGIDFSEKNDQKSEEEQV